MEPITTAAAISAVVGYLAKTFADNKSVQEFTKDFSTATVEWIKPLFLTSNGEPKDAVKSLQTKPDSNARKKGVESVLEIAIEDNPEAEQYIKSMAAEIYKKAVRGEAVNITGKNINTGTISAGGHSIFGDGNSIGSTAQRHFGSGDNVGGNKITNQ